MLVAFIANTGHNRTMSTITENRFGPSDIAPEEQLRFQRVLSGDVRPVLLTDAGDVIELPKALNDLVRPYIQNFNEQLPPEDRDQRWQIAQPTASTRGRCGGCSCGRARWAAT